MAGCIGIMSGLCQLCQVPSGSCQRSFQVRVEAGELVIYPFLPATPAAHDAMFSDPRYCVSSSSGAAEVVDVSRCSPDSEQRLSVTGKRTSRWWCGCCD